MITHIKQRPQRMVYKVFDNMDIMLTDLAHACLVLCVFLLVLTIFNKAVYLTFNLPQGSHFIVVPL